VEEEGLGLARLHVPGLGRSYVRALLREGYDNRKCLEELGEEELGKVVPKRLAGRIKRRFSGENCKVKERDLQDDSPTEIEGTENTEGRHKVCPYTQNDSRRLTAVLEIDQHRPDRIIFEGKEVKVTTTGFSLLYLLAQHRGQVVSYKDILKELWEDETDAIYTRIIQHIYKFRRDVLNAIGNNKTNKEKVKDIFKVVSGRGVMLNINDMELEIN